MKKTLKQISVLLLALIMVLSLSVTALATEVESNASSVTYVGGAEKFVFLPGSEESPTDLFSHYKKVMPGDVLTQEIEVINKNTDCDYVKIYLQALPHNEENQPVAKGLENVNLEEMTEFLNQMNLVVKNGEKEIFNASAGELDGLENPVLLGSFDQGEAATLTVELTVPEEMDNTFADRIGEIDWQFSVEKRNYPDETDNEKTYKVTVKKVWNDGNSASRPESITVRLTRNGKTYDTVTLSAKNDWRYTWRDLTKASGWEVEEIKIPKGYKESYDSEGRVFTITNTAYLEETGQLNWPIPLLAGIGLALIAGGTTLLRKGRKHNA